MHENEKTKPERDQHETVKHKDADEAGQQDDELEEGLEESMPASDPPASTRPGEGRPDAGPKPT